MDMDNYDLSRRYKSCTEECPYLLKDKAVYLDNNFCGIRMKQKFFFLKKKKKKFILPYLQITTI